MADSDQTSSVWTPLRPYRRQLIVGWVLVVGSVGLQVLIPRALQVGIDALGRRQPADAIRTAEWLIGLVAAQAVLRVLSRVMVFEVGRRVEYDVRRALLDRLHLLGADFCRSLGTGEIVSRAMSDLARVLFANGFALLFLAVSSATYALAISMMLSISWKLTAVMLVPLPLLVIQVRRFGRAQHGLSRTAQDQLGVITGQIQENLAGVRVVRAYALEEHEIAGLDRKNQDLVRTHLSLAALRSLVTSLTGVITAGAIVLVVVFGGWLVGRRAITLGQFVAMQGYFAMLAMPTLQLGEAISVIEMARASWTRLRRILDAVPSVVDSGRLATLASGDLEVSGLSFQHGTRTVLADVSFRVPRGGSLAIVGRTGSGKSTLARLLLRLLPLPAGAVKVGGVDLLDVSLEATRRSIGYSPQDPFLFSRTIAENVAFGLDDPTAPDAGERIRAACRAAHVESDILSFREGYETVVGERGVQLSGGQKQRIALARALVGDHDILVLDDPMSAVDASTERGILDAIDQASGTRTLILVTHRCSAARHADRIAVLEEGRVVEEGTHEELVGRDGLYASFWAQQQLEAELDTIGATGRATETES